MFESVPVFTAWMMAQEGEKRECSGRREQEKRPLNGEYAYIHVNRVSA